MRDAVPGDARVLVVAADPLARAGITGLLAAELGVTVVGATDGADRLTGMRERHAPTVVVWDLGHGGELDPAFECALPTLVLTDLATAARDALWRGARGALQRRLEPERLAAAVRALAAGLTVLDHPVDVLATRPRPAVTTAITPRELEVLELLAEGLSNKEIGATLQISEHTARFHVNALLDRLGARSRTEAAVLALREGLIKL